MFRSITNLHYLLLGLILVLGACYVVINIRHTMVKPIILLVFNGAHDQEADNLYNSLRKNAPELIPSLQVCVSDVSSEKFAARHKLSSFKMSTINESGPYRSRAMNIMTKRKFDAILHVLESKHDVLYIDTDIVFLSNPLAEIKANFDINIQNDLCEAPYHNGYMCTGFMYIKSNTKTINFVKKLIAEIVKDNYKYGDQRTFNGLVKIKDHKLSINVLDVCKFPNGCRYFDKSDANCNPNQALIVHNNYLVGIENKLTRFKDAGLYFS